MPPENPHLDTAPPTGSLVRPTFREALNFWCKLGFISFGGPTGQIAIMHTELVEKKRWIDESRFLHALNYCMLLPGPEAQQLAIYIGWLLHRTLGGVLAGAMFVLPSVFILWLLSYIYVAYGQVPWIEAIFQGLKPAVTAIVAAAVIRIGKKSLKNWVMWAIAGLAFVAIFFLKVPFPVIILSAALIGFLGGKYWKRLFVIQSGHGQPGSREAQALADSDAHFNRARPTLGRTLKVLALCLFLWATPIVCSGLWLGWESTPTQQGFFFSKAAMVTFGGAYAVLPYVAQQAVERFGWLSAPQMLDGLGLAETTPGPLIMVVQFVGFLGAWHHPGQLSPLVAATLGALLTTWVTFVPCFLWILAGAPFIERMRNLPLLNSALSAITAAVVGVVLNLAVWFAIHVLIRENQQIDFYALLVSIAAFLLMVRWKWDMMLVLLLAAVAGLIKMWL